MTDQNTISQLANVSCEEFFATYQGQAVLVHETFQQDNSAWISFDDGHEKEVSLESLDLSQ